VEKDGKYLRKEWEAFKKKVENSLEDLAEQMTRERVNLMELLEVWRAKF
jgi:hypothetical protein